MKKIAVVGSINMDLVVETSKLPEKGETILGDNFFSGPGGKGANQAVAISRLGGDVTFFGCVGEDYFGTELEEYLMLENVESRIRKDPDLSTGVALVNLFENDNNIIVVSGANGYYSEDYFEKLVNELLNYDIILFQLEINEELVFRLIEKLAEYKKQIILNPAPACKIETSLVEKITYLTPNEHECQIVFDSKKPIEKIVKEYPEKLIVTHGDKGAFYSTEDKVINVSPINITNIIDTTGAGDTFSGAFAYSVSIGMPIKKSVEFANTAAGLSIRKKGAQAGMPTLKEVKDRLMVLNKEGD